MELDEQLLVEEYKSCRELILKNIDIMEKNEVYATGACAAIFVFSLQTSDHLVSKITAWLPLLIAALGWLSTWNFWIFSDEACSALFWEIEAKQSIFSTASPRQQ